MMFTIASFNILAQAYVERDRYRGSSVADLDAVGRRAVLLRELCAIDADILCLQEVEPDAFDDIRTMLAPRGFEAAFVQKGRNRPDGCAMAVRRSRFESVKWSSLQYADQCGEDGHDSGHVAQLARLGSGTGPEIVVANTHLRWSPPGTPDESHCGFRQIRQFLREMPTGSNVERVICGDFNVQPEHAVVALALAAGFTDVDAMDNRPTCAANGPPRRIDFILASHGLRAQEVRVPNLRGVTPLPSAVHASDHVPIIAKLKM